MIIVADENIPFVREAFAHLGEVRTMSGRAITAEAARDAECLLVRSVTTVNRALLEGSRVGFVATATSGFDHIDVAYLKTAGIGFAYAPGSNAVSVAEWVVAALLHYAVRARVPLAGKSIGIIGAGHVGSAVARRMNAIGLRVTLNDPPLFEQTDDKRYRPLAEALACDFVTLHTPLTREGPHATRHLADTAFFAAMKPGTVFINTARGAVADTAALKQALATGHLAATMLNVWENEPRLDADFARMACLATPHIAGYSFDGKIRGAEMICQATCEHFRAKPVFDWSSALPHPAHPIVPCDQTPPQENKPHCPANLPIPRDQPRASTEEILHGAVREAYDIATDDARLRETLDLPPDARAASFTRLRKEYPIRREFRAHEVVETNLSPEIVCALRGWGFAPQR